MICVNTICFAEVKYDYNESNKSFIVKYEKDMEVYTNTFSLKTGKFIPSNTIAKIIFSKYYWFDKNKYDKKVNKYKPVYSVSVSSVGKDRLEFGKIFFYELFENDETLFLPSESVKYYKKRIFFDDVESRVELEPELYCYAHAVKFLKENNKLLQHFKNGKPAEIFLENYTNMIVPAIKIDSKQALEIKKVLEYDLYSDKERLQKISMATIPPA